MTMASDALPGDVPGRKSASGDSQSLSSRVRKGALWVVASNLLLRLANVLLTAVIARILSPHDFGVFAVALTAYGIISSLGELGVSSCLIRADLDIDRLAPTVTTISVISSVIFAGAMAALARPIATALGSVAAVGPVRVLALAVLLLGVFAVPTAQMARDFKQDKVFLANAIAFVPSTVLLIILAEAGSGAMAFAWSMVVRQLVVGCVLFVSAPRYYRPGLTRTALSVVLTFGIPLAAANFVNFTLLNVDYAFVGHLLGAVSLGIYLLAFAVASWPSALLGGVINNVSMPAFSRVKHDSALLMNAMAAAVRAVSLIVMPICAMLIALAHPLVLALYGQKWKAVANVLVILALYSAIFVICLLFANMLTSLGRTKTLLLLQIIWIGTLVPAMLIGVHKDRIMGAAYAHVAVIAPIVLPSYLLAIKRVTGVRLTALGRAVIPALVGSSLAALAARGAASQFSVPLAQLGAGLAAGGMVYLLCAGRQGITIFGRGRAVERALRLYSGAARLVGLPADNRARHSARHVRRRGLAPLNDTGPLGQRVLAEQGRQLTAERVEDLAFGANVGYAYRTMDWLAQAVSLHERTVADRERGLGVDHAHTLAARTNLAHAYRQAGSLAKAIPLYERTLADMQRLLGADHPRTFRCANYLAAAYREAGRLADAILLYEQTLDGRRRLLGADHPSTLRSSTYLARAYLDADRVAEAIPLLERTVDSRRRSLGANDPSTLRSSTYLARAYLDAGRAAAAIPLYEQAVSSRRRQLGTDHPGTLRSSIDLARAYLDAGRPADAIPLCEQTLAHCSQVLGSDHALTRAAGTILGDTQSADRRHEAGHQPGPSGHGDDAPPRFISGSPPPSPVGSAQNGTTSSAARADVVAEASE
jgi:lipopolysaccharide exporter